MLRKYAIFGPGTDAANGGKGYYPDDIRGYYNLPANLDGSGQSIGILEFSNGFRLADAQDFWQMHSIGTPEVEFVSVDGTQNDHGSSAQDQEASLDLQWAGALAPGARLLVYEANAGNDYASFARALSNTLNYILNDESHRPSVLSISYGDAEASFGAQAVAEWGDLIARLDETGVTVCVASGDQGAYGRHSTQPGGPQDRNVDAPASAPACVAVGGTSLRSDGAETAWSFRRAENGGATGGGYSDVFARPDFQSALPGPNGRGVPDVAFDADPVTGYQIIFQGRNAVVGGTSVACPVFAAIVALSNQSRADQGRSPLTGLTQTLYAQAAQIPYHDVTMGDNDFEGVKGYAAGTGWDPCTGWGSVDAAGLIQFLTNR